MRALPFTPAAPVSTFYAMREALALVAEEGLETMWSRHQEMHHRWGACPCHFLQPPFEELQLSRAEYGADVELRWGPRSLCPLGGRRHRRVSGVRR